ncbi:hypothetical protein FXN61_40100, partial [Lentzea sp. PSKA42]|nr:hypothetical protein [Lentzea indica]
CADSGPARRSPGRRARPSSAGRRGDGPRRELGVVAARRERPRLVGGLIPGPARGRPAPSMGGVLRSRSPTLAEVSSA